MELSGVDPGLWPALGKHVSRQGGNRKRRYHADGSEPLYIVFPYANPLRQATPGKALHELRHMHHLQTDLPSSYTSQNIKREFDDLLARVTSPRAPPTLLFTIFLGANDACLIGDSEYVPLPKFEENIRGFVDTILNRNELVRANVMLITPPPINIPDPLPDDGQGSSQDPKLDRGYRTYLSKKKYADKIMQIAAEYEHTGRVIGLNYWKALVDAALKEQGRLGQEDSYDEERLPGCGLSGAKAFGKGYFTDGLHLNTVVCGMPILRYLG